MTINIGIEKNQREAVAEVLSHLLADTYLLYLKTQNFHWNVTGPQFQSLHAMFETQYQALALAVDALAERIRALGFPAPGAYAQFIKLASIKEESGVPTADAMLKQLIADRETIIREVRAKFEVLEAASDEASIDLIIGQLDEHEKTAWMLRSSL